MPNFANRLLAGVLAGAMSSVAMAEQVACRYTYGGESRVLTARPAASPYAAPAIKVGSFFKFRVVFQAQPADLASIKIYAYADRDGGPEPIHQAIYPYPPAANPGAPYGFTGRQFVYEPELGGELEYWCRLQPDEEGAE
ncbi:MAG: hypothetical protein PHX38_01500 [Sulfuricella sp.]|nr:hypothetical protein [Sulfuricella sp.]